MNPFLWLIDTIINIFIWLLIALAMVVIAATDRGWPLMANWQARFPRWSQ